MGALVSMQGIAPRQRFDLQMGPSHLKLRFIERLRRQFTMLYSVTQWNSSEIVLRRCWRVCSALLYLSRR